MNRVRHDIGVISIDVSSEKHILNDGDFVSRHSSFPIREETMSGKSNATTQSNKLDDKVASDAAIESTKNDNITGTDADNTASTGNTDTKLSDTTVEEHESASAVKAKASSSKKRNGSNRRKRKSSDAKKPAVKKELSVTPSGIVAEPSDADAIVKETSSVDDKVDVSVAASVDDALEHEVDAIMHEIDGDDVSTDKAENTSDNFAKQDEHADDVALVDDVHENVDDVVPQEAHDGHGEHDEDSPTDAASNGNEITDTDDTEVKHQLDAASDDTSSDAATDVDNETADVAVTDADENDDKQYEQPVPDDTNDNADDASIDAVDNDVTAETVDSDTDSHDDVVDENEADDTSDDSDANVDSDTDDVVDDADEDSDGDTDKPADTTADDDATNADEEDSNVDDVASDVSETEASDNAVDADTKEHQVDVPQDETDVLSRIKGIAVGIVSSVSSTIAAIREKADERRMAREQVDTDQAESGDVTDAAKKETEEERLAVMSDAAEQTAIAAEEHEKAQSAADEGNSETSDSDSADGDSSDEPAASDVDIRSTDGNSPDADTACDSTDYSAVVDSIKQDAPSYGSGDDELDIELPGEGEDGSKFDDESADPFADNTGHIQYPGQATTGEKGVLYELPLKPDGTVDVVVSTQPIDAEPPRRGQRLIPNVSRDESPMPEERIEVITSGLVHVDPYSDDSRQRAEDRARYEHLLKKGRR